MAAHIIGRPKVNKRLRCREIQALRGNVSSLVYDALRTPGQPLSPAIRAFFEYHFHRDFSRVRVHTDECAAASAYVTNTVAYTVGNHIVFGEGQYAPWTPDGRTLLAHELTHVVQQGQTAPVLSGFFPVTTPGDAFEREADECARAIIARAAADPRQELSVMCETDGPVFQGWWIDQQASAGIHGQTHQLITRTVVNETAFAGWFHADCKDLLIRGSAQPDLEKADAERRLGRVGAAAMYHGWGANEGVYLTNIAAFVSAAANHLNAKSQEADRRRLSVELDFMCLDRSLRDMMGKALHATQDKAAHQTPCRVPQQCTSTEMDDPSVNTMGWRWAFENTRLVLREFHAKLSETSKRWVKNGPQRGGPTMLPHRDNRRP